MFNNGNDWLGFIFLAMIFGWGGNGFGFGGRGAGAGVLATDSLISDEFNFNTLNNGIRGLERGLCDLGYSLVFNPFVGGYVITSPSCPVQSQPAKDEKSEEVGDTK